MHSKRNQPLILKMNISNQEIHRRIRSPIRTNRQRTNSIPEIVPTVDVKTMNFGFVPFCSRGKTAWKRRMGPAVLTSQCFIRSEVFISATFWKAAILKMPALAITMSSLLMLWGAKVKVLIAVRASISEVLSIWMNISYFQRFLSGRRGLWLRGIRCCGRCRLRWCWVVGGIVGWSLCRFLYGDELVGSGWNGKVSTNRCWLLWWER